ncbi:hypothetical protein SCT_0047 [Sulfuricella sp. T08]|uniref:hypothetical protein n=1 Tax=Sulfuricella sp. T08 TaxID=1632857 RepID=UPI0006179DAA|nr:hypothetical protein [Sulfuricella sp. T08]GAO34668.1 hypothetical protein SCT_0047 [Sulfuricella sp. T08]
MADQTKGWLAGVFTIASLLTGSVHADQPGDAIRKPAVFRVTTDVVNQNVLPFTATINGFGNSLINEGAGFEPVVFRDKLIALEDSPNRIIADPVAISRYDTLREGFLDQATVQIYRIENGRFRMVREDRVKTGGSHASGWIRAIDDSQVVAPGTTRFSFSWASWNRPRAKYYFTVRAIDKYGSLSPAAPAFEIDSPEKLGAAPAAQNVLVAFKPAKALFSSPKPTPAPRALKGKLGSNGALTLEWNPVDSPDLAGYIVYRSDYPPHQHSGYYLQLTGTPASAVQHIKAGDMVIVSKKNYSPSRNRDLSNRVWGVGPEYSNLLPKLLNTFPDETPGKGWSLAPHAANTPVEEPGETCLKLQLASGTKESLTIYNHSGTGQFWYDVLEKKPYTVEVWMRQEGSGTVQFKLTGFYDTVPQKIKPMVFNVGHDWKKYVAHFTPTVTQGGSTPNRMELEFTGPATFYVDNFRVYRADTAYLDLLPHELEAIKSSGISALRTHGLIKTGTRTYDMEQLTNSGGVISGTGKSNTLPQTLMMMRKAGVQPWLQIEFHMSPQEWLAFIEYMAAPFNPKVDTPASKPWAYKRYSQGQAKPWTEEFDHIYFELSNETWNGLFAPWTFSAMTDAASKKIYSPGQVYGLFQEHVRAIMRSSPYWLPAALDRKFVFMLGGWAGNMGYSHDAASASPSSNFLTIAAYNGGWDEAEDPPKLGATGLFNTLAQVNQLAIPVAELYAKELLDLKAKGAGKLHLGTYEAGPGYVLNGLNNARVTEEQANAQEQVMKSLAAGTATLDSFLARAYRGFDVQNFFTFDSGMLWKSHAKWYHGGQAYPSWKLLALFNNEASGDMLRTETLSVPSTDLKAFSRRQTIKDAPLAAVYATHKGDRYSLFMLSRKVPDYPVGDDDGYTPVNVELPFSEAKSVTLYRMTGTPQANNLLSDNVRIEKLEIPPSKLGRRFSLNAETGADERGLPPASTFLYVFDGVNAIKGTIQSPKK